MVGELRCLKVRALVTSGSPVSLAPEEGLPELPACCNSAACGHPWSCPEWEKGNVRNHHCQVLLINILWLFIVSNRKTEKSVTYLWPPSPILFAEQVFTSDEVLPRALPEGVVTLGP